MGVFRLILRTERCSCDRQRLAGVENPIVHCLRAVLGFWASGMILDTVKEVSMPVELISYSVAFLQAACPVPSLLARNKREFNFLPKHDTSIEMLVAVFRNLFSPGTSIVHDVVSIVDIRIDIAEALSGLEDGLPHVSQLVTSNTALLRRDVQVWTVGAVVVSGH